LIEASEEEKPTDIIPRMSCFNMIFITPAEMFLVTVFS